MGKQVDKHVFTDLIKEFDMVYKGIQRELKAFSKKSKLWYTCFRNI